MKSPKAKTIFLSALIAIGFCFVFVLSNFVEANRPPLPDNYADRDLALQGAKLKDYSLGFNGLIADWYWMQSLQYVGDKFAKSGARLDIEDLRSLNVRLLYPLLDNATTLDPRFMVAYSYGAVVLPAIDAEQAIKLTEKGIGANPEEWRLYQHLGYIYWRLENYEKASGVYGAGAKINGAPPFMRALSASMKNKGGDRDTARAIYRQMYESAEDSRTKEQASLRLMELDSLDERDAIRAVLKKFNEFNDRCAQSFNEIIPMLEWVKLQDGKEFRIDKLNNLVDPSDAPYILDREKCDVFLDPKKTKVPLG